MVVESAIQGEVLSPGQNAYPHQAVQGMGPSTRAEDVDIFATEEEIPVALPGTNFTVMVLRELDWGRQADLEAAALRGIERDDLVRAATGKTTLIMDTAKQRTMLVALRITRWNVKRKNPATGDWEPVRLPQHLNERMEVVRKLRPKWVRTLIAKIEEIDKEQEEDEPAMPELMAPQEDVGPPKVTANGVTDEQSEM